MKYEYNEYLVIKARELKGIVNKLEKTQECNKRKLIDAYALDTLKELKLNRQDKGKVVDIYKNLIKLDLTTIKQVAIIFNR